MTTNNSDMYVTANGQFVHCVYDSRLREDILMPVYGVHRHTSGIWMWNASRGPARDITDEWLRSEDGQDFKSQMDGWINDISERFGDFDPFDDDEDEPDDEKT